MANLGDRVRKVWLLGRRLFEFAIGLFFLSLAVVGGEASMMEWRKYLNRPSVGLSMLVYVCVAFTVALIFFALYSFLKARSIR
ncbi:MAG: hypothetical protein ACRD18_04925 [Terriglobia bacterium]